MGWAELNWAEIVATRHQMAKVLKAESIGNVAALWRRSWILLLPKFFYVKQKKGSEKKNFMRTFLFPITRIANK